MAESARVAIIGLDCAEPALVFERWRDDLPHLRQLAERGCWGRLESCIPPITVPAWACMASGRDPGELGVYGFRNRADWSYDNLRIASSADITVPRLWQRVAEAGGSSIILGVPPTFPTPGEHRGALLSCFLTPSTRSTFTAPASLADTLGERFGPILLDVDDFRTEDKSALLERIRLLAQQRFAIARYLLKTQPWQLFWMVEMGVDRLHHGFWQFMDPRHHRYVPGHPLADAIHDYYVMIDRQIGELLPLLEREDTALWVVSDHGATCMEGGFCLNDWLIARGLLSMKTPIAGRRPFDVRDVDWSRTKVWGEGGYYGRLFLNVAGREPTGIVAPEACDGLLRAVGDALAEVRDPAGNLMGNRLHRPGEIYRAVRGFPPDGIAVLGELRWRSVGSIGNDQLHVFDNDTGPDDANHAQHGLYILSLPGGPRGERDASIYDVFPTSLQWLGLDPPGDLRGRVIAARTA